MNTENEILKKENKDMWKMLDEINNIMWNGPMIKDNGFKMQDVIKIMEVLNKWAVKY